MSSTTSREHPRPPGRRAGGTGPRGGYRYDLDGLRGVAIALVVVFHVWMGTVSGGVDIFLLLSGFFFLGSLMRGAFDPQTSLNPLPHLWRLVRRLYPILVLTIGVTIGLTMWVRPEPQWSGIFDQAVASLLYFQNWELAWTAQDYGAADAEVSPLQHLWSMAVQGQFYLIVLAAVLGVAALWRLVVRRGSPKWFIVALLAGATAWSMLIAFTGWQDDQAYNYYSTWARLWEIFVGGLLAVLLIGVVLPRVLRFVFTVAGAVLIVSTGWVFDGGAEFPGPWAWYPLGGALLIILGGALPAGQRPNPLSEPVTWFLSRRPLRYLGDIAYSLYLWHWPLLIMWLSYTNQGTVSFLEGAGIIALSLILAMLSERLIERPLRMPSRAKPKVSTPAAIAAARLRPRRSTHSRTAIIASTMVVVFAGTFSVATVTSWNLTEEERLAVPEITPQLDPTMPGARAFISGLSVPELDAFVPNTLQVGNDLPLSTWDGCIADFQDPRVVSCTYGDEHADRTIALVGGSHAEHWLGGLDELGREHGFRVVTILKMGCPLSLGGDVSDTGEELYEGCVEWSEDAIGALLELSPEYIFTTSTRPVTPTGPDFTPKAYPDLWAALTEHGIGVLAIRDTPWLIDAAGPRRAGDCLAGGGTPTECGKERLGALNTIDPATMAVAGLPDVHLLDLTDGLCDATDCPGVVGNVIVYHDSHHLSQTWVRSASPEMGRQIGVATGWW